MSKNRVGILIYEYALIANLFWSFEGLKTQALFFCFFVTAGISVVHWFLPEIGKKILLAIVSGFLSWFMWIFILSAIIYNLNINSGYPEHSPLDLVELAMPVLIGIGYGLWTVLKRSSMKLLDQIYLGLVSIAFLIAAILDK